MEINQKAVNNKTEVKLGRTIQVRLVSDLKKSQEYYRDVLGCKVDDWGHAERDEMLFILQQATSQDDVRPNVISQKRPNYPTEWEGPNHGWDSFIHISWENLDQYVEEVRSKGGIIAIEPFTGAHGKWEFKNAHIQDIDGYSLVLGAMRLKNEENI
ncbi:VOC family protein [Paenibacillus sp. FA6]|uniref:VOC family protein n=1 Tax=Paenibacillus sp. FA6 TaxID=3413029 RepID=UPI003F65FBBA